MLFPAVRSQHFLKVFYQSVCKEEPGINRVLRNGRHQSTALSYPLAAGSPLDDFRFTQ
jgi:hypothetical protein